MEFGRNKRWFSVFLGGLLILSMLLAITKGAVSLNWSHLDDIQRNILIYVRIPRVLLAALVGASLVLAGILFQYVMQNPLADSFTTGASASAALGAVLALFLGKSLLILPVALLFTLAGLLVVYRIASYRGRLLPVTMLLAGIVISTFASASISLLKYLSEDSVASMVFWLMGGFQNASYLRCLVLGVILGISLLFLHRRLLALDLIGFDDATALSSGVPVDRLRRELLFWGALLTSFSVAFAGIIGFVGLIVPHLLRLLGLYRSEELLRNGFLAGALFMVIADLIARTLLPQGEELPVGILTSVMGGLFFLHLLVKRKRSLYELA